MESQKIRAAVIGYGGAFNMGRLHANSMIEAGMEFVAACDSDVERTKAAGEEFPGIKTYTDYREMLKNPDIDLVTIILPHNLHAEASIACSEAGKHVVVEKPMCLSTEQADAMIDAAKKNNVLLSVYQNRRWDADFIAIKKLIDERMIGDVVHIELSIGGYQHPGTWWRSIKEISGGILFDWGAHMVDWTLQLVSSDVAWVAGNLFNGIWDDVTNEDHGQMLIKFKTGAMADIQVSQLNSIPKPKWRILGTRGGILGDWGEPITVKVEHQGHLAEFQVDPGPDQWGGYYPTIVEAITSGQAPRVKAEESRKVIAVIEAAEKSDKIGQTVALS